MAAIKCKMCGGDLVLTPDSTVAECEYCGTRQTVPTADSEKKLTLFARANRLRLACEFDKAAGVYENIVSEFPTEAEAYWGLVLCRYGIEYVDDPATGKKVPTCHRSSFDSVLDDSDFEQACENADPIARRVYRDEAKAIEDIRKGILEVSGKEPPYDIFICYKETDENGERTVDSVLAQDVYDALTEKGYRVFFSRITLEDKLGTEYEPYIFAALNSAKIMLVFGTDYEYFNAVWVKNEWSRFLKLMAQDKNKHLIPCYKGVDAYDMPKEFQKLQGQDMGKVGAVQDLLRGIDKLLGKGQAAQAAAPAQGAGGPTVESLLKRAWMFLGDGNWESANEYFDKVLDIDPECGEAYAGKLCVELNCTSPDQIAEQRTVGKVTDSLNYNKTVQFGDNDLRTRLDAWLALVQENEEADRRESEAQLQSLAAIRQHAQGLLIVSPSTTVGLRADGTVAATGKYVSGVSDWQDIVAVAACDLHTVGLRADGTVVATWEEVQKKIADWRNIVAVAASNYHTVGLRTDGLVVAAGVNREGQCKVSDWREIVAVAAGFEHTVGLRADGTVVATGKNKAGQCGVSHWRDIVAVATCDLHTVGLRADGTVVATWEEVQKKIADWRNIVAVAASNYHTVGLRADGTVVATGDNKYGQCDVSGWRLFSSAETLETERTAVHQRGEEARQRRQEEERCRQEEERRREEEQRAQRRNALETERARLQAESPNIKGLFSGGKRRQVEARLAEIEAELARL